jgi:hypothetical protein
MALRLILCTVVSAGSNLRGRQLFQLSFPPNTQFERGAISILPPAPAPETRKQEAYFGNSPAATYLQDQVTDVNWGEFGHKALHGSLQCVPHCLKYALPQNEERPFHHTVTKVGQCLLWECIPNAVRNAGKPGPLVADALDVVQLKLEQARHEREERERETMQAFQMQAMMKHDLDLELELEETRRDDQLAWTCAGAAGAVALALGFVALQKPRKSDSLALVPV